MSKTIHFNWNSFEMKCLRKREENSCLPFLFCLREGEREREHNSLYTFFISFFSWTVYLHLRLLLTAVIFLCLTIVTITSLTNSLAYCHYRHRYHRDHHQHRHFIIFFNQLRWSLQSSTVLVFSSRWWVRFIRTLFFFFFFLVVVVIFSDFLQ